MKTLAAILLLALASPAMAAESDSKPNAERYVADDLVHVTLPTGEAVTRLVSRSGITTQQFWAGPVYGKSILVFPGTGGVIQGFTGADIGRPVDSQKER